MATGMGKRSGDDPRRLINSLLTCDAYVTAIAAGMVQWKAGQDIDIRVTGIARPTMSMSGDIIDGGCEDPHPAGTHLTSKEDLIRTEQYVARYLHYLADKVAEL